MASVLGRIVTSDDSPRGPDVKHRIRVSRDWLESGEAIEFPLPRNLACAKCDGGGCDTCASAGALSVRSRSDPNELVRVVLPRTVSNADEKPRAVALRIPERGGLPADERLPRGMLILTMVAAETTDEGVRKVHPSLVPEDVRASSMPPRELPAGGQPPRVSWPVVVLAAIVAWIFLLVLLRAAGAF